MTQYRFSLAPLLVWCCFTAAVSAADGVEWLRSAEKAAELSEKTGKPILIYVRSETCYYCDLMQKDVWEDPTIVTMIKRQFIPLKLTREQNKAGVEAMKVKGYPSTLIFSPEREFIGRIDGYLDAEKFQRTVAGLQVAATPNPSVLQR